MKLSLTSVLQRWTRLGAMLLLTALAGSAWASVQTTQPPLRPIPIDLHDQAALRTGALYTLHMCVACHGIQGARYSELPPLLGLDKAEFLKTIGSNGRHYHDTITSNMSAALMMKFVDMAPPDLTEIAHRRSPAWLYTYLTSFYVDPARPTGVNNVAFYNVAMPDVFADMQGLQKPVMVDGLRFGSPAKIAVGVQPLTAGAMSRAQFDQTAKDIVTFLYAVAHPHQQERMRLGPWIIGLFVMLSVLTYLIYRLYWARVITGKQRWWRIR